MARTVGFSLTESDEERLDRLVARRRSASRSKFLREALAVMERYDRVRTLEELQAYGEGKAAAAGRSPSEVADIVLRVATGDDPALRERVDIMIEGLHFSDPPAPVSLDERHPAVRGFLDALGEDVADGG